MIINKTTILIAPLILMTVSCTSLNGNSKNIQNSRALKEAALKCDVSKFSEFMDLKASKNIESLQQLMDKSHALSQSHFKKAKAIFGDDVVTTEDGFRVIVQSKDHSWLSLLGPSSAARLDDPNSPNFDFRIEFKLKWTDECPIVQSLQACQEDSAFCKETSSVNSLIALKKADEVWKLVNNQTDYDFARALDFTSKLLKVQTWLDTYLDQLAEYDISENLKLKFATDFQRKMMETMSGA